MGKRGPKVTPQHLKVVAGVEERRQNPDEPQPDKPAPGVDLTVPMRGLGAKPSAVWRRLAPDLVKKRMLTPWDVDLFAAYCVAVSQYNDARRLVQRNGLTAIGSQDQLVVSPFFRAQNLALEAALKLGARFGLTPADRANISLVIDLGAPDTGAGQRPAGPERLLS